MKPFINSILIEESTQEKNIGGFVVKQAESNYKSGKVVEIGHIINLETGCELDLSNDLPIGSEVVYVEKSDKFYSEVSGDKTLKVIPWTCVVGVK